MRSKRICPNPKTGAGALDLAKTDTENIALITETAFRLCTGDPKTLTGRIAHTQPFLAEVGWTAPADELAELYRAESGCGLGDLGWFTALACFKSAATWSLIIKHNRRRAAPRAEWEAMAVAVPRLLERARSMLD